MKSGSRVVDSVRFLLFHVGYLLYLLNLDLTCTICFFVVAVILQLCFTWHVVSMATNLFSWN